MLEPRPDGQSPPPRRVAPRPRSRTPRRSRGHFRSQPARRSRCGEAFHLARPSGALAGEGAWKGRKAFELPSGTPLRVRSGRSIGGPPSANEAGALRKSNWTNMVPSTFGKWFRIGRAAPARRPSQPLLSRRAVSTSRPRRVAALRPAAARGPPPLPAASLLPAAGQRRPQASGASCPCGGAKPAPRRRQLAASGSGAKLVPRKRQRES